MNSNFVLKPEAVAFTSAGSKSEILDLVANTFARAWDLDPAIVLEQLEEREKLGSTGFGRGVAIPHARFPGLSRPVAAVIKLAKPVDFDAADGLPVDLVFGLLSPENCGATHLHALAAVSRMMRDDRMHDALSDAPNVEALYSLVTNVTDRDAA
ncbi:PTS sugar transporter subunit IIA [Aurantiacibacter sp. MUD61]|uniref:PTS sugar transporter subunit IIA n=1 Tax=Aurantiacibacter sp. MUD61 TaxID=3009083 RepID=UPI0022F0FEE6|nr:PTS sugar transporter subunit IIA [Aurantiacibacter sp. MUD61]